MTEPRERDTESLYVTDAELIRRLGVPEKIARERIRVLDKDPRRTGFPQKQKFWGDRRYWPAVKAYFDQVGGVTMPPASQPKEAYRDRKSA
jgi:hypothetical protein